MTPREKLALLVTDFVLVLAAVFLAMGLRLENDWVRIFDFMQDPLLFFGLPAFTVFLFYLFGLYEKVWRYAGTHELLGIVSATTVAMLPFQVYSMFGAGATFPRTAPFLTGLVTVTICGGIRLLLRFASERMGKPITSTRTIIVGVNDAGENIVRELSRGRKSHIVICFVDERDNLKGMRVRGIPVKGNIQDLPTLIDAHRVTEVVLAQPSPSEVRQVMELVQKREVNLRVVPALHDVVAGRVELSRMRQLSIEDLLEREPVRVDPEFVRPLLAGRTVLITGAGGSIGSEIARQVSSFGPAELVLVGRGENSLYEIGQELPKARLVVCDVCRSRILHQVFEQYRPQVVFHAAAHKHVPLMETAPAEAVYTNVFGTLAVLDACREFGVERFVLLSTDKAVNPGNIMGATKRAAEMLVAQRADAGFAAVRFGNVLGSRGSVVPTMQKQIQRGGPVTVTDPKMTRYFMTIPEAVTLVLQASGMARGGEIYLLDMGKPVKILDLAHNLIRLCGYEPEKEIAIHITGCRPGEKLEEELVGRGESTEATEVSKIEKVLSPPPGPDWPGPLLEELRQACLNGENRECRRLLMQLLQPVRVQDVGEPQSEASPTR